MKKFLSTILAFIMIVSCLSFSSFAAEADGSEKSYNLSKYIKFFYDVGVFNSEYGEAAELTRADYAQILTRLINKDGSLDSYRGIIYKDVSVDYPNSKEINFMNLTNILNGKTADMFYPEDILTLNEAAAGIVRMLGYGTKANATGGFGTGYIRTATDLGALKGVPSELTQSYASAGAVAKMLFNVLETPMVQSYIYNGEKVENISDVTLLKNYLELEKGYGMVTGVDGLLLDGSSNQSLEFNEVLIGNEKYLTSGVDMSEYFGIYIDFYYKKKDENSTSPVIYSVVSKKTSKELVIYGDDIKATDSKSITYLDNEKNKNVTVKLSDGVFILYNGKNVVSMSNDYVPANGYIRLISTSGSSYDLAVIYDYQSFVVMSSARGKISFKYGLKYTDDRNVQHSTLDLNDIDLSVVIKKNGKTIKAEDIESDNVVSIASSGNKYFVEVSDKAVKGVIKGTKTSPMRYLVLGEYYEVDSEYLKAVEDPANKLDQLEIGLNSTFYIDFMGKITGTSGGILAYKYAYLHGVSTDGAFYDNVKVKLYAESVGEFEIFDISDKCLLNGQKMDNEDIYNNLVDFIADCESKSNYITAGAYAGQLNNYQPPLIKFKSKGDVITAITTKTYEVVAKDGTPNNITTVSRTMPVSDDYILISSPYTAPNYRKIWQESSNFFTSHNSDVGNVFANNVPCIKMPVNKEEELFDTSEEAHDILPKTDNVGVNVMFYDMDFETGTPKLIAYIVAGVGKNTNIKNMLYCVESVSRGYECAIMELYARTGAKVTLTTNSDDDVIKSALALERGDVIQIATDSKGYVELVCKRFSYNRPADFNKNYYTTSGTDPVTGMDNFYNITGNGHCLLLSKFLKYTKTAAGDIAVFNVMNPSTGVHMIYRISDSVLIYDGNEFYTGTISDIAEGDYVFGVPYIGDATNIVVFKYDTPQYTDADEFMAKK